MKWERGVVVKEWICKEEPLIRADGASVGVGFRRMVELVRCKDCKHHGNYECHITMLTSQVTEDDWYCADGERRNDDGRR